MPKKKPTSRILHRQRVAVATRKIEKDTYRKIQGEFDRQASATWAYLERHGINDYLYKDATKQREEHFGKSFSYEKAMADMDVPWDWLKDASQDWKNEVAKDKMVKILQKQNMVAGKSGGNIALGKMGAVGVNFNLQDPKLIKALYKRGDMIGGIVNDNTLARFQNVLVDRYYFHGESVYDVKKAIFGMFTETYKNRSWTIARTETGGAQMEVENATYKENEATGKRWLTTSDERVRESHLRCEQQGVIPFDDKFSNGLRHPMEYGAPPEECVNCFLPGTMVSGNFIGGSKAFYSGKCVEIKTGRNNRCSTTPNHPVFTLERGWIPACKVQIGDTLVTYDSKVGDIVLGNIHNQQGEAFVEDIFNSIKANGRIGSTVITALDFNGDGKFAEGDVDIVLLNGSLSDDVGDGFLDKIKNKDFVLSHSGKRIFDSFRSSNSCSQRVFTPSASNPSGRALMFNSYRIFLDEQPFIFFGVGSPSNCDAMFNESFFNSSTVNPHEIRKLFETCPVEIFFDKVIDIRYFDYSGHVYDLQSISESLFANGILYHNCRCDMLPVFRDEKVAKKFKEVWAGGLSRVSVRRNIVKHKE